MDSSVLEEDKRSPVRYVAVRGVREVGRDRSLANMISRVSKMEEHSHLVGFSDVVIWDMGTPAFPMMSVVASTCRGWLSIDIKGRKHVTDDFGISFTPREMSVLKQFFDAWKLAGLQTVADAIKNIYEQTYVKDFKTSLNCDEFKVFINKLLQVVNKTDKEAV